METNRWNVEWTDGAGRVVVARVWADGIDDARHTAAGVVRRSGYDAGSLIDARAWADAGAR